MDADWKYVYSAPDQREFLFDRKAPHLDSEDLSQAKEHSAVFQTLRAALISHLKENGEQAALDGDSWKKYPIQTISDDPNDGLLFQDHPWADEFIPGYSQN